MRWKKVCYVTLDYKLRLYDSKPPLFHELNLFKKINKVMKMLTKQYYGYKFTNLIRTNILKIVFDVIIYSIVNILLSFS